jgi:hypothetical protein
MYHYVYKLTHRETNEFYIGSRTSKLSPDEDTYLGSMKSWKPEVNKLQKTIIKTFSTRKEAVQYEIDLLKIFIEDELNRNYHIPSLGFHTQGLKRNDEWKLWNSKRLKGKNNPQYGKYHGLDDEEVKSRLLKINDVDFSKFGWVKKVSDKLNITHTQTRRFINKYFNGKTYNRKNNGTGNIS